MPPWHGAKTKVQLKLTSQRCSLLQEKKNAMAKKERREIASLIERGKLETARIKTEGVIGEDIAVELLEIMELYSEMLIARFALLELNTREPDPAIREPLCAIIHAAPRIELREMHALREMLMSKYGREFAVAAMENTDNCVSERVMSRLRIETPSKELVEMYIAEICRAYDVPFSSPYLAAPVDDEGDDNIPKPKPLAAADGDQGAKSELPVSNEKASTAQDAKITSTTAASTATGTTKNNDNERLEDLEARFAALKRR